MPPYLILAANVVVTVILVTVGATLFLSRRSNRTPAALALLPLVDAALLVAFVFGEDSYRDDGTSRWDAYRSPGGALGPMFVVCVALLIGCAALLAYAGQRGRRRLFASTACLFGTTAFFLVAGTIIGFSAN